MNPPREVAMNRHSYMLPDADVESAWSLSHHLDVFLAETKYPASGMFPVPTDAVGGKSVKTKVWILNDLHFDAPGLRGLNVAVMKKANAVPGLYSPTRRLIIMNITLDMVAHPAWWFSYLLHELIHANEYGLTGKKYVIGADAKHALGWEIRPYESAHTKDEYYFNEEEFNAYSLGYTHLLSYLLKAVLAFHPDMGKNEIGLYKVAASKSLAHVAAMDAHFIPTIKYLGSQELNDMVKGMQLLMDALFSEYSRNKDLEYRFRERIFYALQDLEGNA